MSKTCLTLVLVVLCLISTGCQGRKLSITLDHAENFAVPDVDIKEDALQLAKQIAYHRGRHRRAADWSADNLLKDTAWEVDWDTPTQSVEKKKEVSENGFQDVVVVDLRQADRAKKSFMQSYGVFVLVPGGLVGAALIAFCFWCCFFKPKSSKGYCSCCKKKGHRIAQKYIPGVTIDEKGNATYHEVTEEEAEALAELINTVQD